MNKGEGHNKLITVNNNIQMANILKTICLFQAQPIYLATRNKIDRKTLLLNFNRKWRVRTFNFVYESNFLLQCFSCSLDTTLLRVMNFISSQN